MNLVNRLVFALVAILLTASVWLSLPSGAAKAGKHEKRLKIRTKLSGVKSKIKVVQHQLQVTKHKEFVAASQLDDARDRLHASQRRLHMTDIAYGRAREDLARQTKRLKLTEERLKA